MSKHLKKKSELEEWLDFGRFDGRETWSYERNDQRNMTGEPVLIFCTNVEENTHKDAPSAFTTARRVSSVTIVPRFRRFVLVLDK